MLIPNLLTACNLLVGLAALSAAWRGHLSLAWGLVLLCALLDGLDGKVARRLGGVSRFGREFDSCADLISFGSVPAVSAYCSLRPQVPPAVIAAAGFYFLCAAGRLIRFDRLVPSAPEGGFRYFLGLPTTASAVCYALWMLLIPSAAGDVPLQISLLLVLSLLMISRIPFPKFGTL